MSNAAWFDLSSKGDVIKLQDTCGKSGCKCRKRTTFTPMQYHSEGGSLKSERRKIFRCAQKAWNSFFRPGLKLITILI